MKVSGVPLDVIPLGSVIRSVIKNVTMKDVEMIMVIATVFSSKTREIPLMKALKVKKKEPWRTRLMTHREKLWS